MSWPWKGRNWQGRAQHGRTVKKPLEFVQRQYERGFTWLSVTNDRDENVGWIHSDGNGGRTWWAEGKELCNELHPATLNARCALPKGHPGDHDLALGEGG